MAQPKENQSKQNKIISLKDVWKIYKMGDVDVFALKQVSLTINQGEYVAITGASGSGKSTMMNLVGCLDIPTKGIVYLDGNDISTLSESTLAQIRGQKIGFVFQQFNLIPHLTALENVMLPMEFQDNSTSFARNKAMELLRIVGLNDRMAHRPTQLSGGQQQRVAIARSLSNDPEVILADEPTGNLDTASGTEIIALLDKLWKRGKTIIIVTHDLKVASHAKRIVRLMDGKIVGE